MKIVIAGAGEVGFHIAELLCSENQDIILIDINEEVLEYAAAHLDVITICGDASSLEVLETAEAHRADLVVAVTTSEKINIITAIVANKLGAKQTIARADTKSYLEQSQKQFFKDLGVGALFSPKQLAANEIVRLINRCSFTDLFEFEDGKLNVAGITIDDDSPLVNRRVKEIPEADLGVNLKPIAILRGHKTIIPRGDTVLRRQDHVYMITKKENLERLENFIEARIKKVKKIMILGGKGLGFETAKKLESDYKVTIVEKSKDYCKYMAENMDNALVIHGDHANIDLLIEEGLDEMDAFIAVTPNAETNIVSSLAAKNHGIIKTIALVENKEYTHISQNIGVDTLINKKLIAANNIFRFIRKGQIEAITSLHGVDAEIIEYVIHKANRITKNPLKKLRFPDTALIIGVIRGEESYIPTGDFVLNVEDKVIVFAVTSTVPHLERFFK